MGESQWSDLGDARGRVLTVVSLCDAQRVVFHGCGIVATEEMVTKMEDLGSSRLGFLKDYMTAHGGARGDRVDGQCEIENINGGCCEVCMPCWVCGAFLLSNTAKMAGVNPQIAVTIPKRCNLANRPVGYKCGPYTLP
ncbi:hypothetical protein LR48_Vigan03g148100 [Vigna angularis]|uniref:Bifunctional inhibitor/plant lipid transfer protein/seed storage helical domain-containing protein n=1 Tax=Phaseolus angularis TaxID=3914 RepID=A0A0L9U6N8_PHAAN|nr:hypothetical protein LR48_Vigan03g148100 [Vigna angularis]